MCYGVPSNVKNWKTFVPRIVNDQTSSMDTANAVVMSLALVHKIAIVFGWRFNLSCKRQRSVAAGVLGPVQCDGGFNDLLVVVRNFKNPSTPTSEKSRTAPYNRLFWGLEERRRQMRSPWLRLNCMDIHQGLALFIVDFVKFGYGPMACHAWKCVHSWYVPFERTKREVSACKLFCRR